MKIGNKIVRLNELINKIYLILNYIKYNLKKTYIFLRDSEPLI